MVSCDGFFLQRPDALAGMSGMLDPNGLLVRLACHGCGKLIDHDALIFDR